MEDDTKSVIWHGRGRGDNLDSSTRRQWQAYKRRRLSDGSTNPSGSGSSPSRFKGVVLLQNGHWGAQIYTNHQRIWLGTFKSDKDAAMAYDSAAIRLRRDDLHRNFPWNASNYEERKFQNRLTTDAVLNMIKDGTYQSRFEDYLRNRKPSPCDAVKTGSNADKLSACNNSSHGNTNEEGWIGSGTTVGTSLAPCQQLFQKELTLSDVGKLNRLVIPKKYALRHFPRLASGVDHTELVLFDRGMKAWAFRYCYWKSSQSFVFTRGWSRFIKDKKLKEKDVITFYKCEARKDLESKEVRRTFLMIDVGGESSLCYIKGLGEMTQAARQETSSPVASEEQGGGGVRLFGVQIG